MSDLKIVHWKRHGHDRLYVNLPDGTAVAWADRRTGKVTILLEPHRREALKMLRPRLVRAEVPPVKVPPPRRIQVGRAEMPRLPELTPANDLATNPLALR